MRTLRVLGVAYKLGHVVKGEGDQVIPLLGRLIAHARTTAKYGVFYGEGRDIYDVRGRTAHEAIFNVANGAFRCVGTQQGYSGFSTWTRGLSWAMCGFAELLEFVEALPATAWAPFVARTKLPLSWRRLPRRHAISSSTTPPATESPIGIREHQECAISTIPTGVRRSRKTTSSRSTVRRRQSVRKGCCAMARGGRPADARAASVTDRQV